ncbi:MAG: two-component system cell cycle response regulator [Phenylobacterium sp.]|jgi:two-component system cell cycle response regulator
MSVFNINNISKDTQNLSDKPIIMIIDDEVENVNVLRRLLENDYQVITSLSGTEALEHIDGMDNPQDIQLIVSDQRMPGVTGIEFFQKIISVMPDTIRIILTGYSDTQAIIDSVNKAKLYKFITKPFNPAELTLTIKRGIEAYQMQQQLLEYTSELEKKVRERTEELELKNDVLNETLQQLERISLTDQLTGAHNRRFVAKMIPGELAKLQREHFVPAGAEQPENPPGNLGLISIDADYFKRVNDNYGHDAGDKVLIQLVEVLTDTCRGSDWVIRWGGEEFLVAVRFLKRAEIHRLAERIRENVANHVFDLGNGQTLKCTCSIGICALPFVKEQFTAVSWEQTLSLADLALYAVKANGRNGWLSLFQTQTTDPDTFFRQAQDNLPLLIEQGQVDFETSLDKSAVNFSSKA